MILLQLPYQEYSAVTAAQEPVANLSLWHCVFVMEKVSRDSSVPGLSYRPRAVPSLALVSWLLVAL